MEIQKEQRGNILTLRLSGRLDAYSADHLGSDLAEIVRTGTHHIELNLAAVDYLSSAGIRVLVNGAWGFAASGTVTKKEIERVAKLAVRIARASTGRDRVAVGMLP